MEMRAFVEGELRPHAAAWEAAGSFPDADFAQLAGTVMRDGPGHPDPWSALLHLFLRGVEHEDQRPFRASLVVTMNPDARSE